MGPCKTLFMDEISTGLDSSTTYQIVRCIRNMVHLRKVWPIFQRLSVTDAVASESSPLVVIKQTWGAVDSEEFSSCPGRARCA